MDEQEYQGRDLVVWDKRELLERFNIAILESDSIAELNDIRGKAELVRNLAKMAALGLGLQNQAAETRIRAERRMGKLLSQLSLRGGDRRKRSSTHDEYLKLENLGVTRNQSFRSQRLARFSEDVCEAYFQHCRERQTTITDSGLLRCGNARCSAGENECLEQDGIQFPGIRKRLLDFVVQEKRFGCICIFPPWPPTRECGRDNGQHRRYQSFITEMARLPIGDISASASHLHLWSSNERVLDAMRLCRHWGFAYRSILVCTHQPREFGPFWRAENDLMVLAAKGNLTFRNTGLSSVLDLGASTPDSWQQAIRRLIEQAASKPLLSVFGMGSHAGWTIVDGTQRSDAGCVS